MDRRIREALGLDTPWPIEEVLRELSQAAEKLLGRYQYDGHGHEKIRIAQNKAARICSSIALITSEPEPCEDAQKIAEQIDGLYREAVHRKSMEREYQITPAFDWKGLGKDFSAKKEIASKVIASYASQVSDKRAEELRAENDRLTARIGQMQHMIGLVLQDEKNLGGISRFRLGGLLPPPDEALAATDPKTSKEP